MSDEFSEVILLPQAIAGDRAALSQLLLASYDELQRHVVHQLSREPHELMSADDIMQQTFVRAALGIGHFEIRTNSGFRAWLRTIAGNLIRDAQKRRRRERRAFSIYETGAAPGDSSELRSPAIEQLEGNTTSPSMRVHRRDSLQRMRDAMAALPEEQREVIQRHYLQHQSMEQIAAAMHRTKDAVRGISNRARRNLRSLLGHSSRFFSN